MAALQTMTQIICFSKQPILDLMWVNDVQLEHFGRLLDEKVDLINETLEFIQTTEPISILSSFALDFSAG